MMSGVNKLLTAALTIVISATIAIVGPGVANADPLPVLTIAGPTSPVPQGQTMTISGRLTIGGAPSATPLSVQLQWRLVSSTLWHVAAAANTDTNGDVAFSLPGTQTADWQLVHPADSGSGLATSPTITVTVTPKPAPMTATWKKASVRLTHQATILGKGGPAGSSVRLQKKKSGSWRDKGSVPVASNGTFTAQVTPKKPGFKSYRIVRLATSKVPAATVSLASLDVYRLHTYIVRTRGHITANLTTFEASAAATYADPRGWMRAHHRFKRVSTGGDFTLVLAQAKYLPTYSSTCSTLYSCRAGRFVIINQSRWKHSSVHFTGDKATYRQMVVNHETGHWLGLQHLHCSGAGQLAPVMQQQSKGMQGCRPNAWPLQREIDAVS
jgi:hypothetical protein